MEPEIKVYDSNAIIQNVKDKIKDTFVGLIPDAEWEQMIKTEMNRFFNKREYDNKDRPTDFERVTKEEIEKILRGKITTYLKENYESTKWGDNGLIVNDNIQKFITENADKILLSLIGGMIQSNVNNMISNMQNGNRY